ncbi:MAG: electron transfer flavoprotein beta subunit [Haloarculaceae archaeon]|jgi:electron transfer flavoprotein beta subunit
MKVLVPVKEVASVDDEFEIVDDRIDEQFITYSLNEWDDYAIEEAVQLSESEDDVEVVTVTIGSEDSEETIRQGLAKGADRAIRIWDDTIAERQLLDVDTKADMLAAVVEAEEPDLVLSGVQAGDDAFGATGVALARRIDFQWAAVVNDLDLDVDGGVASVHRELEGGLEEVIDVELPAVLTIQTGINEPRYASLRGIRQAQNKPLDEQTLADLGVSMDDAGDLTLREMTEPESESDAEYFEGEPDEQATELADLIREEGVIDA